MANLLEFVRTQILGNYKNQNFILYEEDDHTVTLEHTTCGFKDRFNQSVTPSALLEDCKDHLESCKNK